jgi:hypothetical protein
MKTNYQDALDLLNEATAKLNKATELIKREMIMQEINEYIASVEHNDPAYYKQLKEEGVLFTEFEKCKINNPYIEMNMCFNNAKKVSEILPEFKYYEGIASINRNVLEHAINIVNESAFDFTSFEFGNHIEWFFGCKNITRNDPLLTLKNAEL